MRKGSRQLCIFRRYLVISNKTIKIIFVFFLILDINILKPFKDISKNINFMFFF